MDLTDWKNQAQAKLRTLAESVDVVTPTLGYMTLAASALGPLIGAASQGQAPYGELFALLGGVGGNLLANQVQQWYERSERQLAADLAEKAATNPDWIPLLDTLLEKFDALRVVQAVLSEADKDELIERVGEQLRRELREIGSRLLIGGDWVGGDKVAGDKIDAVVKDSRGVTIGHNNTQINNFYGLADKTPELRTRYLQRLRQRCHVLPLEAMGGEGSIGEGVTLDQVYVTLNTRTNIPLSDEEKAERKKAGQRLGEDEQKVLSAWDAATQHKRLVLLGDPGSGKSTFVQQLVADVATATLAGRALGPGWQPMLLPVITLLRDLAPRLARLALEGKANDKRNDALIEAILTLWREELVNLKCADLADLLEAALDQGSLLLIFDGLDEVPQGTRRLVRSALQALLQRYPQIDRVLVTCRVRSYGGEAELPSFAHHTLAPFTPEQIRSFIAGWYQAQRVLGRVKDGAEQQAKTSDLQQAALAPSLRELAENPMLLTTMAIIHQQDIRLPPQRVQLYKLAVSVLLQRWQNSKGVDISPRLAAVLRNEVTLRDCVERIGYESLRVRLAADSAPRGQRADAAATDEAGDLHRKDLVTLLDAPLYLGDTGLAQEFLDYIDQRAGLVVGRGGVEDEPSRGTGQKPLSYGFPHRTFQEYLAGCYLVSDRHVERAYEDHAAEGDRWELAALLGGEELLFNRANRTKLLDLMYYLCGTTTPRNKPAWRRLLWSAQLATVVERVQIEEDRARNGGRKFLRRLNEQLLVAVGAKSPLAASDRATAGNALAHLGDPRPGVGIKNGLPDLAWSEVIPSGPFIMGSDKTKDKLAWEDEEPQFTCTLITQPYRISRYPITVAQYRTFIAAPGYDQQKYWTEAGWQWRTKNKIDNPATYGGVFELDNHPQVGVSWYEAVAFCRWLAEQRGQSIRLPSEAEWERAARGVAGNLYPWGNGWNQELCNNNELNLGATTSVGLFPGGNAACGAVDMSGNVWEWCSTQWLGNYAEYQANNDDELRGTKRRVGRGGSFDGDHRFVRCAFRLRPNPEGRNYTIGFRFMSPGS